MGLNWSDLRALNGSQREGFEELCSQLARDEAPAGAEFVRKGSPDGGVECFCGFEDGREWGWQAKFFRERLRESQWSQIDRSVRAALEAHPGLIKYFVCVPRDRSDSRRPGVTTELQRWERRVAIWEGWAHERGMEVEFVWWGSSELTDLLSQERQVGRRRFWFGTAAQFSMEWFDKHLERAVGVAGVRYTPEVHVDVPIVEDFELFGRSEFAVAAVRDAAKGVRKTSDYTLRRLARQEAPDATAQLAATVRSVDEVVEALYGMRCPADEQWPFSGVISRIDDALERLDGCVEELSALADAFKQREAAEEDAFSSRSTNPYREAVREAGDLQYALEDASATLARFERAVNNDVMMITGEAGSGKTHLLCDVATRRLAERFPTVILMGQQFTTSDPPWTQAREQLDLPEVSAQEFVGALEAAAQAADTRALFMIDAINEGRGHEIWLVHLVDLLTHLRASPWVGVVVSVRTPFIDHIVPDEVRESAHEVTHHGFAFDTYAAVERFCEHYALMFPATPLLRPAFGNPLFLKILCEGLHRRGEQTIPVGSEGISSVFDRYLGEIDKSLAKERDHDPQDRIVARALDAVASELAATGTRLLSRRRAKELVDPLSPGGGFRGSLYRALVGSGLLMEVPGLGRDGEWTVSFGYEWFADHLIAKRLIARCRNAGDLASVLAGDDAGAMAAWESWNAPLEALSVQLPERLGAELPEVLTDHGTGSFTRAFLKGLPWRDPALIEPACRSLVADMVASARHPDIVDVFDAVVACAVVPGHPLGAVFLDEHLRHLELPDRDASWSRYLYFAYGEDGPLDRLLDWAEKHPERVAELHHDTAAACATVLAWCLTASHRFVRDCATKGLVAVLTNKIALACDMVERFDGVDDPYVRERVMAAAYGVAMRSTDAQALTLLADLVYRLIFADGEPIAHILLRDYARGIIERALHLGSEVIADATLYEPPYHSEWPQIPEARELEKFDPFRENHQSEPSDTERTQGWIHSSVMHMDFALYVIGTNSTSKSHDWLSVPNDQPHWRSDEELAESFREALDPILQTAFDELWAGTRTIQRSLEAVTAGTESADEPLLWYTTRMPYIDPRLEELFTVALSEDQRAAYEAVKAARGRPEPRLGLDIIQRYVLWRVFDLGWTAQRFGELDSLISWTASHSGIGRGDHKPERIGKKYQWIAYHEILAYISDRFQYWQPYTDVGPQHEYRGAWQLRVRDIDPSSLLTGTPLDRRGSDISHQWWRHEMEIASAAEVSHDEWLQRESDIPDQKQQLCFTTPDDGTNWIKLQGLDIWQTPIPSGYGRHEVHHREVWLWANGYLVSAADVEEFISWSKTVNFWNRWMPEPPEAYSSRLFFGELGWSYAFDALLGDIAMPHQPQPTEGGRCPVPLQPAAFHYVAEGGGYDCSITNAYELHRPNSRLLKAMNLQWSGHAADFVDADGVLVAFDPSARDTGSSALLMREDDLKRFLNETGSALVWAMTGEKRAHGPGRLDAAWAGALQLSGAGAYTPDGPTRRLTARLEVPSRATKES